MYRIGCDEGAWRLIVPIYAKGIEGRRIGTYALLDGGSNRHVVSESLGRQLGIEGEKTMMNVMTLDHVLESEREVADVEVEGLNGFTLRLRKAIFGKTLMKLGQNDCIIRRSF